MTARGVERASRSLFAPEGARVRAVAERLRDKGRRERVWARQMGKAVVLAAALAPFVTAAVLQGHIREHFTRAPMSTVSLWLTMSMYFWFPLIFPALLLVRFVPALQIRERRRPPWACPRCRYDMRALGSGVCPECGGAVDLAAQERAMWMPREDFRRWRAAAFAVWMMIVGTWVVQRIQKSHGVPLDVWEWGGIVVGVVVYLGFFFVVSIGFEGALVWNEDAERGRSGP